MPMTGPVMPILTFDTIAANSFANARPGRPSANNQQIFVSSVVLNSGVAAKSPAETLMRQMRITKLTAPGTRRRYSIEIGARSLALFAHASFIHASVSNVSASSRAASRFQCCAPCWLILQSTIRKIGSGRKDQT